jgi:mono/diheme cytochrome c family protein
MSGPGRSAARVAVLLVCSLLAVMRPAAGQEQPPHPFAPTWANLAGASVFAKKECGRCHAIRGFGATAAPDLSRLERKSFFDIGAALSNHLRGVALQRPPLTADEVTSVIAFLFTLQYADQAGDPQAGERLFAAKGCIQCHEVGGKGGRLGPGLDFLKRANSPVLIAAALWNHGPEMVETLKAVGIERPTFAGKELGDVIAYIQTAARDGGAETIRVTAGTPERGEKLFAEKRCIVCHSVAGKGGKVGPELGRRHHVSLTQFASLMWNHAPGMWAQMKARGLQIPRITGQEMADVVAYLYASHYFDQAGDAARGRQLVQDKDCLTCHAVRGTGGKLGADLAAYPALRSSPGLVASLWNHPRYLAAQQKEVPWPVLAGQELADIAAYLGTLPKPSGAPRPRTP